LHGEFNGQSFFARGWGFPMPLQEYIHFDKLYFSSDFTVAEVTLQESENKKIINVRKE